MADPTTYVPTYSFSGWQAVNPSKPLPASPLDNELNNVSQAVLSLVSAVEDVRRSDGKLANGVVTIDSLSDEVKVPWTGGAIAAWATPVDYAAGIAATAAAPATTCYYNGSTYLCTTSHTTTSLFDASKWRIIAAKGASGSGTGDMQSSANLSDVADAAQARTNLGVLGLGGGTLTGGLSVISGSASAPAINFSAATGSGVYRVGTAGFGFAVAGARKFAVLDNGNLRGATDTTLLWGQLGAAADIQGFLTAADKGAARTALDLGGLATKSSVGAAEIADGGVTSVKLADSAVTPAKVASGLVVQVAAAALVSSSTVNTPIPFDDTIPQSSEGAELMTVTITPTSAGSWLVIEAEIFATGNGTAQYTAALFRDSGADAISAGTRYAEGGVTGSTRVSAVVNAGSTSATTFKVRFGAVGVVTATINGVNGSRRLGGALTSTLRVTEVKG